MPDDEQIVELPVVLRIPIARLRGISLVREGEGTGWIMPLADRIPLEEALAAEHAKHVDGILFEDRPNPGGRGTTRWDTGGLRCSCGEWSEPSRDGIRPRAAWHRHVAEVLVGLIPPQAPDPSPED